MRSVCSTWIMFVAVGLLGRVGGAGELDVPRLALEPAALSAAAGTAARVATLADYRAAPNDLRLTLYWENDGGWAKPFDSHDRHYTSGVGLSLAWRALWVDDFLKNVPSFGNEFAGHADFAMGFVGNLSMYTPENITTTVPQNDRPFAGYTYGGLFFQRARRVPPPEFGFPQPARLFNPSSYSAFESLEVDIGILGPSSLGQNAQEMIHHLIKDPKPVGWVNQIHDEPEFSLKYNRRWRSQAVRPIESIPVAFQFLPELGLTVGSLQDELRAGATLRLGYNLPDDFGPGELSNPADFTSQAACACPGIFDNVFANQSVCIFARPYGRFVAHNALLQGDNWRHDDPVTVTPRPAVFAVQCGVGWRLLKHFELAYMTTYESSQFSGQRGWDSWSSVQLSFSLSW